MHTLARRYPHVFKVQKVNNSKPQTPMEIYTATTATMQKYAGLTEDQVNTQSYSLVLEHLERLSKETKWFSKDGAPHVVRSMLPTGLSVLPTTLPIVSSIHLTAQEAKLPGGLMEPLLMCLT